MLHEIIMRRLEADALGSRSIEIYGGAYHLAKRENHTTDDLVRAISNAINKAKFFAPEVRPSEVAKRFCHLMLIDPSLIEIYIGCQWEEIDAKN